MPPKKKPASARKSATKSADAKKKAPARPTRCGPDFKWTPLPKLLDATRRSDTEKVKKLISKGEDPNAALHYAIGRGKLAVVEVLLHAGVDIHTEIKEGDYYLPAPEPPKEKKEDDGEKKEKKKSAKGAKGGDKDDKKKKKKKK